jgi:hypothetical protein
MLEAAAARLFSSQEAQRVLQVLPGRARTPLSEVRETDQAVDAPILGLFPEELFQQLHGCREIPRPKMPERWPALVTPNVSWITELALNRGHDVTIFSRSEHNLEIFQRNPVPAHIKAHS